MNLLAHLSIKRKLTLIIMLTSTVALMLACAAFLGYELITFRSTIVQNVSILADVIGANSTAALVFNDQKAAEETMAALAAEAHIIAAVIYRKDAPAAFARYTRAGDHSLLPMIVLQNGHLFWQNHLLLARPILMAKQPIGTILLQSDLRAMDQRLQRYAGIMLAVLLASSIAAFLLSSQLQHVISRPILHLVTTARAVSEQKDYSVRARKESHDELGLLIDSFNEMLAQIHEQNEALKATLREKEVLLKEIHHRVKNNLQVISSLLNLQSGSLTEPAVAAMFTESQNRIKSMALIHEKLYQSKDLARIDFAEYVRNLTNHLYRSYVVNASLIKLQLAVEDLHLNVDTAIPCGLLLNELVSNSLKYAFPHGRRGEISLRLTRLTASELVLIVRDNGVGLPPGLDIQNTKSLGLKLVQMLTKQLKGTLTCRAEAGTEFQLVFPA